jgi:hypothetical protein
MTSNGDDAQVEALCNVLLPLIFNEDTHVALLDNVVKTDTFDNDKHVVSPVIVVSANVCVSTIFVVGILIAYPV